MSVDPAVFSATSEKGWVHTVCDRRFWLPCPRALPAGFDPGSWAADMSAGWWHISGLPYEQNTVDRLAAMLRVIHDEAYATVPCHQVWIYVRDPAVLPIPLRIGIWKMAGNRDERLLALSGAKDVLAAWPPLVAELKVGRLGAGVRAIRHVSADDGSLRATLGYGLRAAEFETDIQVLATSADPAALVRAAPDLDDFIRGMSVYRKPSLAGEKGAA
jgi:hypothetical protein